MNTLPPVATEAFGKPGVPARWTSSTKEGIGTAYHTGCRVWYTLSHGIVNEVYYPHVDCPNTRDLQFLVTDGATFFHEEKRDLQHEIEYPERGAPYYKLTNTEPDGRYRIVKQIIADPHASVLLISTRLEILDESLRGKLRIYALLAPHLKRAGGGNDGWIFDAAGRRLFYAQRDGIHMAFGCTPDFARRSVGYVGVSDGWRDLHENFQMDWEFPRATGGNIALLGEIVPREGEEFVLGLAFGRTEHAATCKLLQSLAAPFVRHRATYVQQWLRAGTCDDCFAASNSGDGGSMFRLSQCVLHAHEDKIFQGALVASMSIPWGESKGDEDIGGYHLVWPRDLMQSATGLLAAGNAGIARRALAWMAAIQRPDGELPQNCWIDGEAYWTGNQLDEVAAPILLAWRLRRENALELFDPWPTVAQAVGHLIAHGPITAQERWEENSGFSPPTLASIIAALVAAADFARENAGVPTADFLLAYADWLSAHLEEWTVTTCGELVENRPLHYVRITPADATDPHAIADPDHAMVEIKNQGGTHPARNVVSTDFLQLVRLGVRRADDPVIRETIAVIDDVLRRELPQGPCWRRYNFDGYGQKENGGPFDGSGIGRSWPLLTGERGHYALAAGDDPMPFILALEEFANEGGMLPEQVWDVGALAGTRLAPGMPSGSAMPLCWAHAEYLMLVRSRSDGRVFDRIDSAAERYTSGERPVAVFEMWTFAFQPSRVEAGKRLRIILDASATVKWSKDQWTTAQEVATRESGIGSYFADLPALETGGEWVFTFRWEDHWEGRDFRVGAPK